MCVVTPVTQRLFFRMLFDIARNVRVWVFSDSFHEAEDRVWKTAQNLRFAEENRDDKDENSCSGDLGRKVTEERATETSPCSWISLKSQSLSSVTKLVESQRFPFPLYPNMKMYFKLWKSCRCRKVVNWSPPLSCLVLPKIALHPFLLWTSSSISFCQPHRDEGPWVCVTLACFGAFSSCSVLTCFRTKLRECRRKIQVMFSGLDVLQWGIVVGMLICHLSEYLQSVKKLLFRSVVRWRATVSSTSCSSIRLDTSVYLSGQPLSMNISRWRLKVDCAEPQPLFFSFALTSWFWMCCIQLLCFQFSSWPSLEFYDWADGFNGGEFWSHLMRLESDCCIFHWLSFTLEDAANPGQKSWEYLFFSFGEAIYMKQPVVWRGLTMVESPGPEEHCLRTTSSHYPSCCHGFFCQGAQRGIGSMSLIEKLIVAPS